MLRLRGEQLDAFADAGKKAFVVQAVVHLRRHFPGAFEGWEARRLRAFVIDGVTRAELHGFSAASDVVLFLNLAAVLGRAFDTDARTEWVQGHLLDEARPPALRIRRLYADAIRRASQ